MPSPIRIKRIEDRIRQDLSEMLARGQIHDPRLAGISVTDVKVDRELAYANIYVSALEGVSRSKDVLEGLKSASGFLRSTLAAAIDLRSFPRLRFYWDVTPEKADRIERLLAELHKSDTPQETSGEKEESEND